MLLSGREQHRPPLVTDRGLDREMIELDVGSFDIGAVIDDHRRCLGLLVADGLLMAQAEAGRAQVAWMLGAGDLVRPWEMAGISLTRDAQWRALTNARVMRIGRTADSQEQPDPAVIEKLFGRASRTSQWLLASSLILSSPLITERLLLLFEHYGERWGKVTPAGVRIELPLTHELLGHLCGARRSTGPSRSPHWPTTASSLASHATFGCCTGSLSSTPDIPAGPITPPCWASTTGRASHRESPSQYERGRSPVVDAAHVEGGASPSASQRARPRA